MADSKLMKENSFTLVGKLINADVKKATKKSDNSEFVSVTATVQAMLDGVLNEFEVEFMANKLTLDKKENQLYVTYTNLPSMVGKKVQIDGSLRENRFWSTKTTQIASNQVLSGKFVKAVTEDIAETATFILGGFVAAPLADKLKKDNVTVYRHDIKIGVANYSEKAMSSFVLNINPDEKAIINAVKGFKVGDTIKLYGNLRFTVEKVTKEEEGGFGAPITRTFVNRTKNFFITGGKGPYTEDGVKYDTQFVKDLITAYKESEIDIQAKAAERSQSSSQAVTNEAPISNDQIALL